MTEISRSKLEHPVLATAGGPSLHAEIETIYTKLGDNANSRYLTSDALADSTDVDLEHNFNVDFADLGFLLYERNTTTNELIQKLSAGFLVTATIGSEKTHVNVANSSGVSRDIALVVVHGGSGGGGGGSGLQWNPVSGSAPIAVQENNEIVYLFAAGLVQKMSVFLKVPSTYVLGKQITMLLSHYSPSASNTMLLETTSYLIRKDLDAVSSTTNSHASTNAALTNTVADQFREVAVDLTDASGEINSVAVSPGDIVHVDLQRGTDSDTADIRFIPSATEASFT